MKSLSSSSPSPSSPLSLYCRRFWLVPIAIGYLLFEVFLFPSSDTYDFLSSLSASSSSSSSTAKQSSSIKTINRIKQQRLMNEPEVYRMCSCYEPEDNCPLPLTPEELFRTSVLSSSSSAALVPTHGVYRTPGKGLDRCKVQKYGEPYVGTHKVRNSSWPYISEDSYRECSDWIIDTPDYQCHFAATDVQCGDIIFIKADFIDDFFLHHHSKITQPYILVSHASDLAVPTFPVRDILKSNPGKLVRWYAAQLANDHPSDIMSYIPLGINSPGWYTEEGSGMKGHYTTPAEIARTLRDKIRAFLNGTLPTEDTALVAFTVQNNVPERTAALTGATKLGFTMQRVQPNAWPELLHRRLYIWAPLGNPIGIESHRIWESLLGGALPVVRLGEYETLLNCLPFIPIRKWEDITWDEIKIHTIDVLDKLENGYYDFSRIFLNYQIDRFQRAKQRTLKKCGKI